MFNKFFPGKEPKQSNKTLKNIEKQNNIAVETCMSQKGAGQKSRF